MSLTARDLARAHRLAQTLFECAQKIGEHVTHIPLRLPHFSEDAAAAARLTRAELGLPLDSPLAHVTNVLERAGVLVVALPMAMEDMDAFSLWAGREGQQPVIAALSGRPGARQRFSLSHELGHLVVHRVLRGTVRQVEAEADKFAGEFLLPEIAIRRELVPPVTLTLLASLKQKWQVSMQALIMRALELRIITERQRRYLLQQMALRGWGGRNEPIEIPSEKPRLLRQMAEMLYGKPIDYKALASETNLPEALIKEWLAAYQGTDD